MSAWRREWSRSVTDVGGRPSAVLDAAHTESSQTGRDRWSRVAPTASGRALADRYVARVRSPEASVDLGARAREMLRDDLTRTGISSRLRTRQSAPVAAARPIAAGHRRTRAPPRGPVRLQGSRGLRPGARHDLSARDGSEPSVSCAQPTGGPTLACREWYACRVDPTAPARFGTGRGISRANRVHRSTATPRPPGTWRHRSAPTSNP